MRLNGYEISDPAARKDHWAIGSDDIDTTYGGATNRGTCTRRGHENFICFHQGSIFRDRRPDPTEAAHADDSPRIDCQQGLGNRRKMWPRHPRAAGAESQVNISDNAVTDFTFAPESWLHPLTALRDTYTRRGRSRRTSGTACFRTPKFARHARRVRRPCGCGRLTSPTNIARNSALP